MRDGRRQGRDPARRPASRCTTTRSCSRGRARRVPRSTDEDTGGEHVLHERHHGQPQGRRLHHRSTFLHTMGAMTADGLGVRESDAILPVVPMFHANAWGLAHAAVAAGASLVMPGPDLSPTADRRPDRGGEGDRRGRRAHDLDGRAARARRAGTPPACAASRAAARRCRRRCRRPTAAQLGLPILQAWGMTETSPIAAVGWVKSHAAPTLQRRRAGRRSAPRRAAPLLGVEFRVVEPDTARARCRGTARRAASCRPRPLDRRRLLRRRARRRVVHRRRLAAHRRRRHDRRRRATSASSTAPRT